MPDPKQPPSTPVVITRHYDLMLWLMPRVNRFSRAYKFVLGDRIQLECLQVLERLIEASYSRDKRTLLRRASLGIEKLRYLLRCAHDLEQLDRRRYLHAGRHLDEVGRMIGGWLRYQRETAG